MSFWESAYKYGWATISNLKQAVQYQAITADQFKQITGQDYTA